jgi:CRP/FNR family transcriptional regulator, cyclic AMP receptor protein
VDVSRLKPISVFQGMSDEELSQIAPFAEGVAVGEGEELVSEGDYSYEFFAIEDGTAEVLRGGEKVAELGTGDVFGEIGLLERDKRTATVRAKTPMRIITLKSYDLKRLEKASPGAFERIRAAAEERRGGAGGGGGMPPAA